MKRITTMWAVILALGISPSLAQEKAKVSGRMTLAYSPEQINQFEIGDVDYHMMFMVKYAGANASNSKQRFMDKAEVNAFASGDYIMGQGSHHGYLVFTQGDTVYIRFEGKTTMIPSPKGILTLPQGGKVSQSFEGTITFVKGTGKFVNIQGSGTYRWGGDIAKNIFMVDWEGEYTLKP